MPRWSHHETPPKPPHLLDRLWKTIAAAQDDVVGIGAAVSLLDRQGIQRVFMEFQEIDCAPKPDVGNDRMNTLCDLPLLCDARLDGYMLSVNDLFFFFCCIGQPLQMRKPELPSNQVDTSNNQNSLL